MSAGAKLRLDVLVHERGLLDSRERARAAIMAGDVFVAGQRELKPGTQVAQDAEIEYRGGGPEFVSRGGLKLKKALEHFGILPEGRICIDCGASTGGFTDCMLKNGAVKVYAVDVGYGQLAWSIRSDPRVVTLERTNVRYLTREQIPEEPGLATVDVSFISLKLVLPVLAELLSGDGEVVCLVKPQFEAGREQVGKKGVVRDAGVHKAVLDSFVLDAGEAGFAVRGLTYSPIKGPEGNIEYLAHLVRNAHQVRDGEYPPIDTDAVVRRSHTELS